MDTEPYGETKSIALTIQQSSCSSRLLGVLVLAFGVTVAWLALAYGRARISRDQALLPAALLRARVAEVLLSVDDLPQPLIANVNTTSQALNTLSVQLDETYLDAQNYLPPSLPSVTTAPTIQFGAYQIFLQACSLKIDGLEIIVHEGLRPAAGKFSSSMSASLLQELEVLVSKIDSVSGSLPQSEPGLRASISALLSTWNSQVVARSLGDAFRVSAPQPRVKTPVEVRMQIQLLTSLFWVVWGLLAVLLGAAVLIVSNPGFGGTLDLIRCFFWGFGLPVAGQSLQQLTMSNFNSNFGVTLSR